MHERHHIHSFIDTLRRYRGDEEMMTLYAASLIIRMTYVSGAVVNPSVEKMMKLLHVGRNKAKWFLARAKNCMFFRFDEEKDILYVVSNRKLFARRRIDRYGRRIYCAPVKQLNLAKRYTLSEMKTELRAILLEDAIRSSERNGNDRKYNGYKLQDKLTFNSPCGKRGQYLSLRAIGKITGLKHLTQVRRLVTTLVKEGAISSERQMMEKVADADEPRKGFYWGGMTHQLFKSVPNKYHIIKEDVRRSFRHVIFNYEMGKRMSAVHPSTYSSYSKPKSYCARTEEYPW